MFEQLHSYKTCAQMFIPALSVKTCKHPRCSSVREDINKLWDIQTMDYYSALKKKWAIKQLKDVEKT